MKKEFIASYPSSLSDDVLMPPPSCIGPELVERQMGKKTIMMVLKSGEVSDPGGDGEGGRGARGAELEGDLQGGVITDVLGEEAEGAIEDLGGDRAVDDAGFRHGSPMSVNPAIVRSSRVVVGDIWELNLSEEAKCRSPESGCGRRRMKPRRDSVGPNRGIRKSEVALGHDIEITSNMNSMMKRISKSPATIGIQGVTGVGDLLRGEAVVVEVPDAHGVVGARGLKMDTKNTTRDQLMKNRRARKERATS